MDFDDRPQLPLTQRRKVLSGIGAAMCAAQLVAAVVAAPLLTGEDNAHVSALAAIWGLSAIWSVVAVLLIVRQADLPDVATASFLVVISSHAVFALVAALAARGSASEVNIVDTLFLGVTEGALAALIVWAIAMAIARILHLPTTAHLYDSTE